MVKIKIMKNKILGLFLIFLLFHSCKQEKISFIELKQFNLIDTSYLNKEWVINKHVNYIVKNYRNNTKTLKAMDSLVFSLAGDEPKNFTNYNITFYKYSNITNVNHLKDNPRDLDRYSQMNDKVYRYCWINGKFIGRSYEQD